MTLPSEFYLMMNRIWPIILIFMVALIAIRISYIVEREEKFVFYKEFFSLVFVIYVLLLFELVTNTDVQGYGNNFIPFKEILRYKIGSKYFIWNVVGNMLIFFPFGYAISSYIGTKKLDKPLLITFITSTTIECVQLFIGRSFDIDDIILNCVGGLLGYLSYRVIVKIHDSLPELLKKDAFYNFVTILLIITAIIYFAKVGGFNIS